MLIISVSFAIELTTIPTVVLWSIDIYNCVWNVDEFSGRLRFSGNMSLGMLTLIIFETLARFFLYKNT